MPRPCAGRPARYGRRRARRARLRGALVHAQEAKTLDASTSARADRGARASCTTTRAPRSAGSAGHRPRRGARSRSEGAGFAEGHQTRRVPDGAGRRRGGRDCAPAARSRPHVRSRGPRGDKATQETPAIRRLVGCEPLDRAVERSDRAAGLGEKAARPRERPCGADMRSHHFVDKAARVRRQGAPRASTSARARLAGIASRAGARRARRERQVGGEPGGGSGSQPAGDTSNDQGERRVSTARARRRSPPPAGARRTRRNSRERTPGSGRDMSPPPAEHDVERPARLVDLPRGSRDRSA